MATRSTIRTRILSMVANHQMITASDINTLLDTDHEEILEAFSWSRRKEETTITTSATYSTGTVSGSSGSTTLTGSSTVWTSGMADRWIRIGNNSYYYKISSVASATSLTLETALPAAVAASTSYTIFQHVYTLPSNFARIESITSDIRMQESSQADLDRLDPYRNSTATYPTLFVMRGITSSGLYEVEFWPVPSSAVILRANYLKTNSLTADTDSPLYSSELLVLKGAEGACNFLLGRTGDAAWATLSDRYYQRYRTALEEAKNTDLARSSPSTHVRDRDVTGLNVGSDYLIDHDVFWPR